MSQISSDVWTLAGFSLILLIKLASSVDIYSSPEEFCYKGPVCGPDTDKWNGMCRNGTKQSPINLQIPRNQLLGQAIVPLRHLKADHFFLQNNGHTINVDFTDCGPGFFPGYGLTSTRYTFANIHFHWGQTSNVGSEHAVYGHSYSMEMHIVHYKSSYKTIQAAVQSGDPDALAVVAVFLQVSRSATPNPNLSPIVNNLQRVEDSSAPWVKVDEPIDLTKLIPRNNALMYSYKGSLTTPTCNETVNWYIYESPMKIAESDVEAFRRVKNGEGTPLLENHRPLQQQNRRYIDLIELY